jgi:CYTH domain-containing protein
MPVENENKYVLTMSPKFEKKIRKMTKRWYYIEQSYLVRSKGSTVRLRMERNRKDKICYILTVKQKVDEKIIEVEKKINSKDYLELSKAAEGWLTKIRYVIDGWEIDFFKSGDETYFVMAEIEMPDGMVEPEFVPDFIQDNLIYQVPREDFRFSSKKLSDIEYAKNLFEEVAQTGAEAAGDFVGKYPTA